MNPPRSIAGLLVILVFMLAEVPFSLGAWVSVGTAPEQEGVYNVIIRATHNGVTGTFPLQLNVGQIEYSANGLSVEPVPPVDKTTPIELKYDIKLNGSRDFIMVNDSIAVYYASGRTVLSSEAGNLALQNDSYWHAIVDVPFKGEYKAIITLIIHKDGQFYGGRFVTYFKSDTASDKLVIKHSLDKRILIPSESFKAIVEANFEDHPLPNLELFKVNVYGTVKRLMWNSGDWEYKTSLTAPTTEGIYVVSFYAEGQDFISQEKVYVTDLSKAKSGRCPLASGSNCIDMKDVRKCVSDYKGELIKVSEDKLAQCFEAASGGIVQGSIICGNARGDLDGDEQLDIDDVDILQNMILPLTPSARQEYVKCADYNNDGKVDEQDLQCLTNVVAGKWDGDLNGGVCFDAVYDSALKCDLTGDKFIRQDDVKLFNKLMNASLDDIEMSKRALGTCDFDLDGKITREDGTCLNYFVGMDLDKPETLLASGQTIQSKCTRIYNLNNCQKVAGDVNGDLMIDEVDEILEMLIEKKQVTSYGMQCADVNKDGRITTEDVMCVKSYTSGNKENYFVCIGCTDNTPAAYRNIAEICGDGYDNDCDGLVDRSSTGPDDYCSCNQNTPCWMVQDVDGGVKPGVDDANVKVCRKLEGAENVGAAPGASTTGGYKWYSPNELTCSKDRECKTMLCATTVYKCAYGAYGYKWYDIDAGVPVETDMPTDTPKTCEDGHDNDCHCGDMKCQKEEKGSMFKSSSFWIGMALGVGLGMWGYTTYIPTLLSYVSTIASFVVDDPGMQAGLAGFGLGTALGAWGGGKLNLGGTGGGTTTPATAGQPGTPAQWTRGANGWTYTPAIPGSPGAGVSGGFNPLGWTGSLGTLVPGATSGPLVTSGAAVLGMAAAGIGILVNQKSYAEKTKKWVPQAQSCSENE